MVAVAVVRNAPCLLDICNLRSDKLSFFDITLEEIIQIPKWWGKARCLFFVLKVYNTCWFLISRPCLRMKCVIFVFIRCVVVACMFLQVQSLEFKIHHWKELNTAKNKNDTAHRNATTQIFEIGKPNKNSRDAAHVGKAWEDFPCCLPSPYSHLAKGMDCKVNTVKQGALKDKRA